MTFRFIAALSAAALLAGCMENQANQVSNAYQFRAKPGFDTGRIASSEVVSISANIPQQRGLVSWAKDVPGAQCIAESQEIVAEFITPAKVALPVIKGNPSPLTITCSNNGQTGRIVKTAELVESNASGNSVFGQDNIVAGVIVGAVGAAIERAEARRLDQWRYVEGATSVTMN